MAKENKLRTTLRKNRVTLDDKYVGLEPFFNPGETPKDEPERGSVWQRSINYYNYHYKPKDFSPYCIRFAEEVLGYKKKDILALKKLKDWQFLKAKSCILHFRGWEHNERDMEYFVPLFKELLENAKLIVEEKKEEQKKKPPQISPVERTRRKVIDTVYGDFEEEVVDQWIEKNYKVKFDMYNKFKLAGLKSNAINMVKDMLQLEYDVLNDAYNKTCDQAVEAYSHVSKSELKSMIKTLDESFSDLERLRDSFKATKLPRAKKPKASDRQIVNLKYNKEDIESKITSINPVLIPGKYRLFVYNVKQKKLTEYICDRTSGFEVSGSTLKFFDPKMSRTTTLRKPDEILPQILNKTARQIENLWSNLTTKIYQPTGRINSDCILLRVMDN